MIIGLFLDKVPSNSLRGDEPVGIRFDLSVNLDLTSELEPATDQRGERQYLKYAEFSVDSQIFLAGNVMFTGFDTFSLCEGM